MFWFYLLLFVATTVISALLKPRTPGPRPSSLGDFQFPTAQEGRPIPVIVGTVKLTGGNTVWYGDLRVSPIRKRPSFLSFSKVTIGYRYYLGVQYMLCHGPIDAIVAIITDNKFVTYIPTGTDPTNLAISLPQLFGGDVGGGEGGISGNISFYMGTDTQGSDPYLSAKQSGGLGAITYTGTGNGKLAFVGPGPGAITETITITAGAPDYSGRMNFSVIGTVSGLLGAAIADMPFGVSQISFTIVTGTIPFVSGDKWTVVMTTARVSPAYPRLCYAVFKQFFFGNTSYPKPIEFVIKRCPDPLALGSSFANLAGDANAAEVIYELLTNADYGLAYSPTRVDTASFVAAATTLKDENLGISMIFDTERTADALIGDILQHVDGVLYTDPATALWTLKLARADYDPATVPILNTSSILGTPEFSRASWQETTNKVVVNYFDREQNYVQRGIPAYDSANIAVTGEVRPNTFDFHGLSNADTATLIAARVLKSMSYPVGKLTLVCDRTAWKWRMAGVFKFDWPPLGISQQIFRIIRIGYGEVRAGAISIDAVEDIFGLNLTAFDPPPVTGWTNPSDAPQPPMFERIEEAPFFLAPDGIRILALCARGSGTDLRFDIYQSSVLTNSSDVFCPAGAISAAYGAWTAARDSTGFNVAAGTDLDLPESTDDDGLFAGSNLALIDDEIVSWKTSTLETDGSYTFSDVLRGQLNTVPQDHVAGARVFFLTSGSALTQPDPYSSDTTVSVKFTPENNLGQFPIGSAVAMGLTTRSRYLRPYPPGNVCYNGNAYATRPASITGDLVVTWSSRNRLTQSQMLPQDSASITGESGQTFSVEIYSDATLVRRVDAIAVETYTYTAVQHAFDDPTLLKLVTLKIFSHTGAAAPSGFDSFFPQVVSVTMS